MHSKSEKGNTGVKKRLPRITVRWITSVFGVIVLILIGFELTISAVIFSYYHKTVENYLTQKAEEMILNYNLNLQQNNYTYLTYTWAADYFHDQDLMELQILTPEGECLYTSIGYAIGQDGASAASDFLTALNTGTTGVYNGRNPGTNERIMAASVPIQDVNGDTVGVLRLLTSLESVNSHVWVLVLTTMAICLGIILFVFTTNYYFIGGIVSPLQRITETANRIAKGDMSARIDNQYRDEVGDLCDSINNMAAELAENDKMKNDFISSISHELRTPLNAIIGFSELLMDDPAPTEKQEYMRIIRSNGEVLIQQLCDILDLSKIEAGTLGYEYTDVELNAVMEELEGGFRMRQPENSPVRITFHRKYPVRYIRTDRKRLIQVIANLLSNAVKFTSEGSVDFGFEIRGGELYVYVADTGAGIPEEHRGQLFQRFVKAGSFRQGIGIGLAISKSIVETMGGRIGVESRPGKGSTFWFTLPCKPEQ